jgi:uncharacterized caspase-like protein
MAGIRKLVVALLALVPLALAMAPSAARAEKRIALVVGNASYQAGALETPANDAGLIAQTLQAAGFDVVGARDLDQDSLRRAFRDFLEKAISSGPDTVAFVYLSGYGLQLEGENYFVPIDARIARDADIAAEALRMSDYTRPLAALRLKASVVVLDAARANQFAAGGPPLAGGLALVDPEPGVLIAFNAAPGTVAPAEQGSYGHYAQALAEMMREGGLPLAGVFERTRLRVNETTRGGLVPWHASKVQAAVLFFERAPDAPPPAVAPEQTAAVRARPMRELNAQEAYALALERDTMQGYSDFLAAYPDDPMAKRVRAIAAARREAITWRRTRLIDTPPAYWSYLRRYPDGPHATDAQRRLAYLSAAFEPPPSFAAVDYELPPPPPEEVVYVRRSVLAFDDPEYAFAEPPPPPVVFLAPPPPEFVVLAPPPPPVAVFVLPVPVYRPVPVWVRTPAYIAPPPRNNVIHANIHNTVVVNNVTNTVTVTNRSGQTKTLPPPQAVAPSGGPTSGAGGRPAPVAAVGPSLPPSVAQKAVNLPNPPPPGQGPQPGAPGQAARQPSGQPGQPLPGMKGQPLPPAPSVATTGTPPPGAGVRPGAPSPQTPAAKLVPPSTPSAAATPGTPPPVPGAGARPGAPPQAPAAKLVPPSTPPAAGTGTTPPAPGVGARPGAPPPSANIKPATPPPSLPPAGMAKPAAQPPPQAPAASLAPPPSTNARPVTPPPSGPPPGMARPAPPPPQAPAARLTAPPPPPSANARPQAPPTYAPASIPRPAAAPPPQAAPRMAPPPQAAPRMAPPPQVAAPRMAPPPQAAPRPAPPPPARGCPPGRTMVNGVCR